MPVISSPTRSRYSSNIMSRSASRMRWRITCFAVCAAMRPKSSGVTSASSIWSRYSSHVAGLMGDPLAELERDAVGMIDEQAQGVAADHFGEQYLHLRLGRGEAGLD